MDASRSEPNVAWSNELGSSDGWADGDPLGARWASSPIQTVSMRIRRPAGPPAEGELTPSFKLTPPSSAAADLVCASKPAPLTNGKTVGGRGLSNNGLRRGVLRSEFGRRVDVNEAGLETVSEWIASAGNARLAMTTQQMRRTRI